MSAIQRRTFLALSAALVALPAFADASEIFEGKTPGVAINGYDPVAYFKEGRPVEGSADFATEWRGTTWRFASAANRDAFAADPEAYAPQYAGFCAYGVAQGYKVKTEPEQWSIVDGKLYLNYDAGVQRRFSQDARGYIATADREWPKVR